MRVLALLAFIALAAAHVHFKETFDSSWSDRWVISDWKKGSGEAGKFEVRAGDWYGDAEADKGLATTQDARFYAASAKFHKFSNEGKDLVLQFQVRFPQKIDCGGGYLKFLPSTLDQKNFQGDSEYAIMFGPDICGLSTKRVHVIFHYPKKNENLLIKKTITAETDQLSHVYTLIVHPDNTYEVRIDGKKKESGSLKEDFDFLAPEKIKDPSISKPHDWVDDAMMDDPEDKKPSDWDSTPAQIPDPDAEKPEDWDNEADGEWEAPMISNPEYKGEWKPRRISNPSYKGPWVHPEIANPDFHDDPHLYRYTDIGAVGVDVWQVKAGTIYDNIFISDSISEAEAFMAETYGKGKDKEKQMFEDHENKQKEQAKKAEESAKAAAPADEDEDEDDHEDHEDL